MALTATSESSLTSSLGQLCRSNRLCQQQEQSCPAVACDDTRRLHEARRLPMALPTASSVSVAAVINYNSIPIASGVAHTTPDYRPVAAHVNGCCGILSGRPADEQSLYNCRCWPSTTGYPHHRSSVALGCLSTSSNWNRPPASLHHNNTQNESSGGKVLIVRRRMSAEGVKLHHNVHCELHQQGAISDGDSSGPFDGCSRDSDKFRLMVVPMQSSGSFAMSNCASPPVSPFHRRLSGVLTSSGWRPKLSRAVSEYSLYGRRMADARDYQRTCCGNIGWRSATDDDSPPRIVPISGQLSKVSSQAIVRPVPFKPVPFDSRQSTGPLTSTYIRRSSGTSDVTSVPSNPPQSSSGCARSSTDEGYASSSRSGGVGVGRPGNRSSSSEDASNSTSGQTADSAASVDLDAEQYSPPDQEQDDKGSRSLHGAKQPRQSSSGGNILLPGCSDSESTAAGGDSSRWLSSSAMAVSATSNVHQLEVALHGKETELQRLRETMEQNETAIVEVLQERRRSWQAQMLAMSAEWERKLRYEEQKSFRKEQSLMMQICRLQQDNRELVQQLQSLHLRSAHGGESIDNIVPTYECAEQPGFVVADELRAARSRLDELRWELDERNGEVATLSARVEVAELRIEELAAELTEERQKVNNAVERALAADRRSAAAERKRYAACEEADHLRIEMDRIKVMAGREQIEFERERDRWLDEKRRVIDYQKQLQLNYVQMARKNRILESDVEQLTAEIERNANTSTPLSKVNVSPVGRGSTVEHCGKAVAEGSVANESLC